MGFFSQKTEKINVEDVAVKAVGILAVLGSLFAIGILTYASAFSVIVSDDYWFAADTGRNLGGIQYVTACFARMINEYLHWQGTFFSEFISSLFNPVNNGGFKILRVEMVLNTLFSFIALLFLLKAALNTAYDGGKYVKLIIVGCIVFGMTQYDVFPEIFFWYTGATVNSVPLTLACLAVGLLIYALKNNNRVCLCFSCITGFLAAGGTLAVSGTLCYTVLMMAVYYWIKDKRIPVSGIVTFAFCFISSLINAAAPGNFERQGIQTEVGLDVFETLTNTSLVYMDELNWLFVAYNFGAVFAVLIVCGILLSENTLVDRKAWYITGIPALLTPAVTIFPVVMGYRLRWIPNRCHYIAIMAFVLALANIALILGDILGRTLKERRKYAEAVLFIAALVIMLASPFDIRSFRTVRIVKGLYDHTYQDNYSETKELLESLKDRAGEDVEVDVALDPNEVEYYYSFYLVDANDRINQGVAWAYDLGSITNIRTIED